MVFSAIIALSLRETGCESNYLFSFSYDSLCTSDYQDQSLVMRQHAHTIRDAPFGLVYFGHVFYTRL